MSAARWHWLMLFACTLFCALSCVGGTSLADSAKAKTTRPAALAGSWYPESAAVAIDDLHRMLRVASKAPAPAGRLRALVVPHAGWRYSGVAAAAAFRLLSPGQFERVVVVAPSHRGRFTGFSVPDTQAYRTPLGAIPLCLDALSWLEDAPMVRKVPGVHDQEHAIEIELPFLQETLGDFCLVPILAGQTTAQHQRLLADKLSGLDDGLTLFVFSSDFTHYGPRFGFTPYGQSAPPLREQIRSLDYRGLRLIEAANARGFRSYLEETEATICGRHGLAVLLELLPLIAPKATATRLAEYASNDLPGFSDDNSVSYFSLAFTTGAKEKTQVAPLAAPASPPICPLRKQPVEPHFGQLLVRLARAAIETELRGRSDLHEQLRALPEDPRWDCQQSVFVTLNRTRPEQIRRRGKLRGCVGQIFPTYPLHQSVVVAAVSAALHDRRFEPVHATELDTLAVEVTLLSPPWAIDSWQEIELGTHGIVLEKKDRRAVYLPQVPGEQGWDLPETLSHLARKAGLPEDAWRQGTKFQVFTGQVFHEPLPTTDPGSH